MPELLSDLGKSVWSLEASSVLSPGHLTCLGSWQRPLLQEAPLTLASPGKMAGNLPGARQGRAETWRARADAITLGEGMEWGHDVGINSAAMNIGVLVSLSLLVSSVCMPSSGIAGS